MVFLIYIKHLRLILQPPDCVARDCDSPVWSIYQKRKMLERMSRRFNNFNIFAQLVFIKRKYEIVILFEICIVCYKLRFPENPGEQNMIRMAM